MRVQGRNSVGEEYTSAYVLHDPKDYQLVTDGPSLTRQEFTEECDINTIMARYEKTGVVRHLNAASPQYLDLSNVPDLQQALSVIREAEAAFMALPAKVRAEFANDTQAFIRFAEDPQNLEQMRAWGLAKPAERTPEPLAVRVVEESPQAPAASAAGAAKP